MLTRTFLRFQSLSNRFSVLRLPEQSVNQSFVPPLPAGVFTLEDMRKRFAHQRSASVVDDYMTEEEEAALLADLEETIRRQQESRPEIGSGFSSLPESDDSLQSPRSDSTTQRSSGRAYGFGSSEAMREAEVMRNAKDRYRHQQPLLNRELISASPSSGDYHPGLPDAGSRDQLLRTQTQAGGIDNAASQTSYKRRSVVEAMSPAAQQRISRAILLVEADLLSSAQSSRAPSLQSAPTVAQAAKQLPARTPTKKVGNDRRNASISRSPAFHDRLADAVTGQGVIAAETSRFPESLTWNGESARSDASTVDEGADLFISKEDTNVHRPPPLALGKPIGYPPNEESAARSNPEQDMGLPTEADSPGAKITKHQRVKNEDIPLSAVSQSTMVTEGTGSYVAESPTETTNLPQQSLTISGHDPLPSPQDYTFDVTGYYGDDSDRYEDHDPLAATRQSPAANDALGRAASPGGSMYSSDYQPSPSEPSFDPPSANNFYSRESHFADLQHDRASGIEFSRDDLRHVQDRLNEVARSKQTGFQKVPGDVAAGLTDLAPALPATPQPDLTAPSDMSSPSRPGPEYPGHLPMNLTAVDKAPDYRDTESRSGVNEPVSVTSSKVDKSRHVERLSSNSHFSGPTLPDVVETSVMSAEVSDRDGAKSRLAQALFGPNESFGEPPSPVGPSHSHRRMESTSSARSYRIDEDPDVRRDFEARIAQATAALQKTPSVRLSRKNTRNKAIKIGSPTLLQTSATLQVSPLTSPQMAQGGFTPSGNSLVRDMRRAGHGKSASVSSLANMEPAPASPKASESTPSGFKGLLAKIKRKPSQKRVANGPMAPIPRRREPAVASEMNPRTPNEPPMDNKRARRSVVRRTLIVPTNVLPALGTTSGASSSAVHSTSTPMDRRPSVKRKPVHRTSKDVALEQELLGTPSLQRAPSQRSRPSRESARDSLFELYGGDEEQHPPLAQTLSPDDYTGQPHSSQMLEIREMSDGEVTWGLVDGTGDTLKDTPVSRQSQRIASQYEESLLGDSSTSSFRKPSMNSNNFDLDEDDAAWSVAERELLESPVERPKTKVIIDHHLGCS